jgi:hypothetical protein
MMFAKHTCSLTLLLTLALGGCTDAPEGPDEEELDEEPALGDTPLPSCEAAMFSLAQIEAELALPEPDLDYVIELYRGQPPDLSGESPTPGGTALQRWVREVGARLGRVEVGVLQDDAAIEQALDTAAMEQGDARKLALLDVLAILREVALLDVRSRLAGVVDALPDPQRDPSLPHAEWDAAWCVWDGTLHALALAAGEDWEPMIVDAFETGSDGIIGPEQPWAPDELATKPTKQIIEKGSFAVVQRNLLALAEQARGGDAFAAREALGLFALIEDRVRDRNTPAIELIRTMLAGELAAIDPEVIEQELAIAFSKRARKYCDEALLADSLGTAEGAKGVEEGRIYTLVVVPTMAELLGEQGFDASAYVQAWADYREAVLADDGARASELSEELIRWNCDFQGALGIAECTDSADEPL